MKPEYITDIDWSLLQKKYPNNISEIIKKLNEHYPVQYLIGNVEFLNTVINVDERVLIPRFETELLVEKTIKKLKQLNLEDPNILELGTGSGCISIALKKNYPSTITAIDISREAISLAKENANLNQVEIQFKNQDMFSTDYDNYDLIISNPPYVELTEKVDKETSYEPQNAIFAPDNGLYFYREILKRMEKIKKKPKIIAFEIGYRQSADVVALGSIYLPEFVAEIENDLTGRERYVFFIKNN